MPSLPRRSLASIHCLTHPFVSIARQSDDLSQLLRTAAYLQQRYAHLGLMVNHAGQDRIFVNSRDHQIPCVPSQVQLVDISPAQVAGDPLPQR